MGYGIAQAGHMAKNQTAQLHHLFSNVWKWKPAFIQRMFQTDKTKMLHNQLTTLYDWQLIHEPTAKLNSILNLQKCNHNTLFRAWLC